MSPPLQVQGQFEGPLARYDGLVSSGRLENDPAQRQVARALQTLFETLAASRMQRKGSSLGWLFARKGKPDPVKGLYLWGDVGRGKTMLMDLFYEPLPLQRKRRVHFHEFMTDVHGRIHQWRQARKDGAVKGDDPIPPVADALAADIRVLCFDEFQVTDIADAMVLGRLFTRLFERHVTVVATSNVAPANLYHNGLNRQLFLPFIALLTQHVDVVELNARTDFRLEKLAGRPVYHAPLGSDTETAMDEAWMRLTGGSAGRPSTLEVKGRTVAVPRAARGVARFSFAELCERPLGAADYLKIAHAFHTVLIDNIPRLSPEKRNEARRFVWLIDALYDNAVKLVASADGLPDELYPAGDTAFEFRRTASRLIEMQSTAYLALPHGQAGPVANPVTQPDG